MTWFADLPRAEASDVARLLTDGLPDRRSTVVLLSGGRPVACVVSASRARGMAGQHAVPGGILHIEHDRLTDFAGDLLHVVLRVGRPVVVLGTPAGSTPAALVPARWLATSPACATAVPTAPERN